MSDTNSDTLDFHLTGDKSQSSSMFPPTELHTRFFPKATPTGQVLQLESRTLSTLLADLSLEPTQIDYLVLDTQGAELKCLGGLGRYIQNLRYLTVEVSTVEYYEGGAQLPELDAYLEARGFLRVSGIPRWKHGDALYLRTSTDGRAADRVLTAVENHQDGEVRDFVNSFIGRGNDVIEDEHFDFASWDEELFQVYERYEAVLGLATSYDVCVAMARFAYDRNMGRSLTAFLKPLRCL